MTYLNIGRPLSIDYACDNGMIDEIEVTIYRSPEDDDGYSHLITLTVWAADGCIGHNFAYAVAYDDTVETRDSGSDSLSLIDELPEAYQNRAFTHVEKWLALFLCEASEVRS